MNLFATLRIAVRALRRNTLRTLLTMLGIIIVPWQKALLLPAAQQMTNLVAHAGLAQSLR